MFFLEYIYLLISLLILHEILEFPIYSNSKNVQHTALISRRKEAIEN